VWDEERLTVIRSVLMKPEHAAFVPELHRRVAAALDGPSLMSLAVLTGGSAELVTKHVVAAEALERTFSNPQRRERHAHSYGRRGCTAVRANHVAPVSSMQLASEA
jgi:hypothetical protein